MKQADPAPDNNSPEASLSTFTSVVGAILAISYPVLAISTLARAGYQLLLKEGVTNYLAPLLTAVAAVLYLLATIGFAYRRRWSWRLSVTALGLETAFTFLVGTLSLLIPEVIGRTVWARFGADYAFFPLIQPILGLIWLTRPEVLRAYGVRE
ncbi:MAG: hypothetical protein KDE29_10990 [Anaerolineales bacterium]|nr:hypothetical protein [Anaerolineales bacterium]